MMKSRKNIALRAVFYVVIVIFVMIQIYPIFWVVCSSLKTPDEMTYTAQYALPSGFYLGNYISALTISSIPKYFMNSTIVAVLTLLGIAEESVISQTAHIIRNNATSRNLASGI